VVALWYILYRIDIRLILITPDSTLLFCIGLFILTLSCVVFLLLCNVWCCVIMILSHLITSHLILFHLISSQLTHFTSSHFTSPHHTFHSCWVVPAAGGSPGILAMGEIPWGLGNTTLSSKPISAVSALLLAGVDTFVSLLPAAEVGIRQSWSRTSC
jgi:hypothetical protein